MSLPERKKTRLREYDYSTPGHYFVTICAKGKQHLFGAIQNGKMRHSDLGQLTLEELHAVEVHRPNVKIDRYVVMPNHIHVIFRIDGRAMTCHGRDGGEARGNQFSKLTPDSISTIVGA